MKTTANDRFKIYYQEKLWEMIPAIYRHEDGLDTNPNPNVLRALVEVMAEQAAVLRRSQDRLWEDQFIDSCDDWAVPYIGELLGTRLLSALNPNGQKKDVAKTIYNRRRKGTPQILEELIHDISSWDGKLTEGFQRLIRARHGLDPKPETLAGRFTGTLPGGVADLRSPVASELTDGPFDEYFHTPDLRKPQGLDGRYGISKLNFYLYRLFAYPVFDVAPFALDSERFTFDPSGRAIPLFAKRNRPGQDGWEQWHSADEWELPAPIRCRLLAHAEYLLKAEHVQQLRDDGLPTDPAKKLAVLIGWRFRNEAELAQHTGFLSTENYRLLLQYSILDKCGKNQLLPGSISVTADLPIGTIPKERITAANLENWWVNTTNKSIAIDPERGQFKFLIAPEIAENASATYHYGFSGPFGAGTYDRSAVEDSEPTVEIAPSSVTIDLAAFGALEVVQINDNRTYQIVSSPPGIQQFVLQAANKQRPYLVLNADLIFTTSAADATLELDGLWFGSPGDSAFNVILQGDYECVIIRNCTLDPGAGEITNALGEKIHPVSLIIEGSVEKLCIENSITGPIFLRNNGLIAEELSIIDSVVQSVDPDIPALYIQTGYTTILRSTIFGSMKVHRLYASEIIITGLAEVTDTQTGCFRFSAAPKEVILTKSRLPGPYESFLFETDSNHWFGSREFGQPAYAQLTETAPAALFRGGENGAEMGVFNRLLNAIKLDGLKSKIEEYMPFGLIPAFINRT